MDIWSILSYNVVLNGKSHLDLLSFSLNALFTTPKWRTRPASSLHLQLVWSRTCVEKVQYDGNWRPVPVLLYSQRGVYECAKCLPKFRVSVTQSKKFVNLNCGAQMKFASIWLRTCFAHAPGHRTVVLHDLYFFGKKV
jgi:hypothetical protein